VVSLEVKKRMNILLVDDDLIDRKLVTRILKKANLNTNVTEALTVDEGLELYTKNTYDIILLDYSMPQRDGIEMVVEIRNGHHLTSTAIVMMSVSEDEELAIACIKAGAQDFLVKSEIAERQLRRALIHASARFELEQQLYRTYQKVKSLSETDSLTLLPNRYHFDESLKFSIINNLRGKTKVALILLDLDNFKNVNDTFGHDVGDKLLMKVVNRIRGCLRDNELFSRLGGDEFAVTLSGLESAEQASLVARRIIMVMQKPFEISKNIIDSTVSIGISMHPDNGGTSEDLFKYADIAMYRAKKQGRNQVCFFEDEMQRQFTRRLEVEVGLRSAVKKNQFVLHYQPIMNPQDESLQGFEALIRWQDGDTLRMPDDFIEIAEETHQISEIGYWVIKESMSTLALWNKFRDTPLSMAINISAVQASEIELVEQIEDCLKLYDIPPRLIDLEITETALFKDVKRSHRVINELHELGCRISLDDFGTGYSSISHLRNYPISIVKIDKSLMPESDQDTKNINLVESLVSMATILGLDVVAEGVEEEFQKSLCKELNVERIQGYLYSKPLSKLDIEEKYLK
jgi:diguanylate cyclase (GGDEF)-like protein